MSEQKEESKPRRRIKKVKGHGGHHGGAWKVAYADFVTAMMALFLVLWLVSQADTKLKESIASYFRSPGVFDTMAGGILPQAKKVSKEPSNLTSKDDEQALFSVAESLQKKFSSRPEFSRNGDRVKMDVTEEGLRIQLIDKAERVSFPSGSAELNEEAREILSEIAKEVCALPNKINIGGHTDSHPLSTNGYTNWELSADRANAARRILESFCVKPLQINRIVGFADTVPLIPDDPFNQANRRISITVLRIAVSQEEKQKSAEGTPITEKGEKSKSTEDAPVSGKSEKSFQKNPTEKSATEKKPAISETQTEKSVRVGEPDVVPSKPKKGV